MEVQANRFTKLDHLYSEAYQSIIQIHAELASRPQNKGGESRTLLNAAKDVLIMNLEHFRNFDR